MSTVISGEDEILFAALREVFLQTAAQGQLVMVVTFSNACPVPEPGDRMREGR
jgi:hypothetical protein